MSYFDTLYKPCLLDRLRATQPTINLMDFLLAGWKFENNINDIMGVYNLSRLGGTEETYVDFIVGKGVDLRNNDAYFIIPDGLVFNIGYTVSFYIDAPNLNSFQAVFGDKNNSFAGFLIDTNEKGLFFYSGSGSVSYVYYDVNAPMHISVIRTNGANYDIYVNSIYKGTSIVADSGFNLLFNSIGSRRLGRLPVSAIIDEFYIFNKALSQQEIQLAMQGL